MTTNTWTVDGGRERNWPRQARWDRVLRGGGARRMGSRVDGRDDRRRVREQSKGGHAGTKNRGGEDDGLGGREGPRRGPRRRTEARESWERSVHFHFH